ncbi:hypothetical protein QQS21_009546 [Conoideocrella luteorostrata]|uniref:Uncharacterized protein n=1 Tax=Conoideocrella luteorostrata TaxID=1105319 RepID=A0AAJ0CHM7_9HYPO|nr:hypothetical protein QQS21_009546 [Conoideocrella luteorostrata]
MLPDATGPSAISATYVVTSTHESQTPHPTKRNAHRVPRVNPTTNANSTSPSPINQPPSTAMPEPDKRASAQQAVDILHEISILLVRSLLMSGSKSAFTEDVPNNAFTELPARSEGYFNMCINDRAGREPRGISGESQRRKSPRLGEADCLIASD